ncbi:hypothetical protein ACHAWT_001239, partial [Skeletonema menzelii]
FGDQKHQQPLDGSAITALPDDYLIPALQIACSLADQICQAKKENGRYPTLGSDWIDNIVVITDGAPAPSSDGDGDARNNIRVEILPSLLSNNTTLDTNNSERKRNSGAIYSLGIVFYEIFSRGERPPGLERKQIESDGSDGSQCQTRTEELLENLDALPFGQGDGKIDLERVDIDDFELFKLDDLQDEYNDFSMQDQNPRTTESKSNDYVMCAVSVEPLKAGGGTGASV